MSLPAANRDLFVGTIALSESFSILRLAVQRFSVVRLVSALRF